MFVNSEGQLFKFPRKNENGESVAGSENEILRASAASPDTLESHMTFIAFCGRPAHAQHLRPTHRLGCPQKLRSPDISCQATKCERMVSMMRTTGVHCPLPPVQVCAP
jgi:hypothetical protein